MLRSCYLWTESVLDEFELTARQVYKWEVFGDLLEAVWYDPEEAPPKFSSCIGSLSEDDAKRVAFELSVGERFMKFSNGFENLINPDGELRCPIVHSLCVTDCLESCYC